MTRSLKTRQITVTLETKQTKKGHRYYLRWYDLNTKKRESRPAGTDSHQAKALQRELEFELNNPERLRSDGESNAIILSEFDLKFQETYECKLKKESIRWYRVPLKNFKRIIGERIFLREITGEDIDRHASTRLKETTIKNVHQELKALRCYFNLAKRWSYLDKNPVDLEIIKPIATKVKILMANRKKRILSFEEEQHIIASIYKQERYTRHDQLRQHGALLLGTHLGMRNGEVRTLRWKDIHLDTGKIDIVNRPGWTVKWGRERHIVADQETLSVLKELKLTKAMSEDYQPFFYTSGPIFSFWFSKIIKRAGIPKIIFHELRKTCATRLAESGVPIQVTKEILGHASIEITQQYYVNISSESKLAGVEQAYQYARNQAENKNKTVTS